MTELTALAADSRHVRLCNLGLTHFPDSLYALSNTLEVLDLSGNQLTALPDDLHRFRRLRILFASSNPFTTLPSVLGRCRQLEMVGFKACHIEQVPEDSLPERLRWLILTDNKISHLPDSLGQRPRLQKLMLSCNRLSSLPDLSACHRLELLRLASNKLHGIPETVLALPSLAWLALAGNPFCTQTEAKELVRADHTAWSLHDMVQEEKLGEGASAHVHRAHHRPSRQDVALKLFKAAHTSDGTPASELAAGLRAQGHPHLLTPLARVDGPDVNSLATAFPLLPTSFVPLAGPPDMASCTRDVYPQTTRFDPDRASRLLSAIQNAVAHLHRNDVIHGDLYAHNILWEPNSGQALLSDFGAAMLTDDLPDKLVSALQAIEWRAFVHLQNEVLARCRQAGQRPAQLTSSADNVTETKP